jgi:hypothetical protein
MISKKNRKTYSLCGSGSGDVIVMTTTTVMAAQVGIHPFRPLLRVTFAFFRRLDFLRRILFTFAISVAKKRLQCSFHQTSIAINRHINRQSCRRQCCTAVAISGNAHACLGRFPFFMQRGLQQHPPAMPLVLKTH